jgi:peroxiredoxin Q/BCP
MLETGKAAPAFSTSDQAGKTVSLADLAGKWVVMWWYPKASTPG